MKISNINNNEIFNILLSVEELILVSTLLGNTFSGGDQWRIAPEVYEDKFGITYEKANKLFWMMRNRYNDHKSEVTISLSKKELEAVKKAIQNMIDKWDEGEFATIIGTEKSKAQLLLDDFDKNGS